MNGLVGLFNCEQIMTWAGTRVAQSLFLMLFAIPYQLWNAALSYKHYALLYSKSHHRTHVSTRAMPRLTCLEWAWLDVVSIVTL